MYSSQLATPDDNPDAEGKGYPADSEVKAWFDPNWEKGASSWLVVSIM